MTEPDPASLSARPARHRAGAVHWLRREAMPLAVMVLLLLAARSSFANHYQVPSGSMQPTLQPGDRVLVDMRAYGLRLPVGDHVLAATGIPQRGDVAVFDSPRDGVRLIKRVVAVAGDHVRLHEGRLVINGRPLAADDGAPAERFDPRLVHLELGSGGGPDIAGLRIPDGKVLVLGDHRGNSIDSRGFGLVDAHALYGRAVAVYYRRGEGLAWRRL